MIFDWILATGLGAALFGKTISEQANKKIIMQSQIDKEKKIADAKASLKDEYIKTFHHYWSHPELAPVYLGRYFVRATTKEEICEILNKELKDFILSYAKGNHKNCVVDSVLYPENTSAIYILESMPLIMTKEEQERILQETNYNPPALRRRDFLTPDFFSEEYPDDIIIDMNEYCYYGAQPWKYMKFTTGSPYAMYHQKHCIKTKIYLQHENDPKFRRAANGLGRMPLTPEEMRTPKDIKRSYPYNRNNQEERKFYAVALTDEYYRLKGETISIADLKLLLRYANISEEYQKQHIIW